ncbi:lipase family protein [Salibacter halophilus]|uniref:lipase family protein n=1 Tax=Salibacter halophilus TaxID=1803916 RepID=UPI0014783D77|nr:lipase family protein [Salibacter halophilus]
MKSNSELAGSDQKELISSEQRIEYRFLLELICGVYAEAFSARFGDNQKKWTLIGKEEFGPYFPFEVPSGFERLSTFYVENNLLPWKSRYNKVLPIGVLLRNGSDHYLIFRGTLAAVEWYHDMLFTQKQWSNGSSEKLLVHSGFNDLFDTVRTAVDLAIDSAQIGEGKLTITGHSLGAALATLSALEWSDLKPRLITFGSPRVGNSIFAKTLEKSVSFHQRIEHIFDPIPNLPPESVKPFYSEYAHAGEQLLIKGSIDTISSYKDLSKKEVLLGHLPSAYFDALDRL